MLELPDHPRKTNIQSWRLCLRSLGLESDADLPLLRFPTRRKKKEERKYWLCLAGPPGGVPSGFSSEDGGRGAKGGRLEISANSLPPFIGRSLNVVTFVGPEEKDSSRYFRDALESEIAKVFEPSARDFAAMVSNCDLFVTCDSGPMHLACGLGTRTVAIFQNPNFDHWGPPSSVARIVYQPGGCSAEEVFRICLEELSADLPAIRDVIPVSASLGES